MRKKNIIFGVICFVLAVVTGGQAFAALGPGEISMGVFSIPLPGCAPEVTISDEKDANDCYTMTIQNKTLQNGVCSSSGINPIPKKVCDGKDGAGGAVDVTKVYVPYPASTFGGTEPQNEGYIKVTIPAADDGEDDTILKYPDYCEEFYEDGLTKKKCTAQGDATDWLNSDNTHNYKQGEWYIFSVDALEDGYPRYEYTAPRSSGGAVVSKGFTQKVYAYDNGRQVTETGATDECKEYAKPDNRSARVTKCTVQDYQYPASLLATWKPNTTTYCLGNNLSDCNQYTILVGAVDACAGLTSSDNAWETTVTATESEYVAHAYSSTCTTNCTGTVGYKLTTEKMCDGNERTSKVYDTCSPATAQSNVACATGYEYQQCTPVDSRARADSYYGCFPDPLNGKYALRDEIVPVSLAADTNNLYYCKIADCDSDSTCWIGGNKANGPNPEATACWGTVSITGLTGDAGPGCSFIYNGTKWQTCCWSVTSGGALDTTQSPTCTDVTGDLLNQLNNWMCKPTYTTKYINKKTDGTYEYKLTATNDRTEATVGIRTTITNCDGTPGGDVDVFDGPAGDDYNPCDELTAGSTAALTTVRNTTNVYVPHGNGSNGTTTGIGYYTETNVMCDTSGNKIVKKYDKCDPVSLASGVSRTVGSKTCSGNQTLLMCTPQEGDLTPYPVCSGAEVSGYPKLEYVQPSESNDKFTAEGYTRWVHKYTATGSEVVGDVNQKDSCHPVYKLSRTNSNNTVTATTSSVQKCQIQSPGTTGFTAGEWYCLNTTDNVATSCNGYSDTISDSETSTLKYHLPVMDATSSTTPVAPGWTYTEETDANSVSLRKTDRNKDECKLLTTRTNSGNTTSTTSVWRCTVGAPNGTSGLGEPYTAGAIYCLNYANGICPSNLTDIGAAIDDAADNDPCNGGTSATAVKKVVSRTYTRTTGSQGALTSVYKMCDGTDHTESTADECKEVVPTPAGETCTNGVWMQCKRQADEGTASATERGTTYGYCATYPQCVGNENSTTIVKKTERAYTAPTKTGTNSYYDTPGKMVTNKIPCSSSASAIVDSSEDDQCEEIPDTNSICPSDKKVLKTCKRKGDENTTDRKAETTYNLCTTGTSIFSAISDNDPCGGDTTSDAAKKKVKNIQYEYIAASGSGTVGYTKKITSMCNSSESPKEEYIYDTCISVSAAGACNGANDKNYKCYNQTKLTSNNAAEREYNVCNPSSNVSSVALADSVKAQSLFEIWKDQYKDKTETECQLLFGDNKKCGVSDNNLTASDMLNSFTAYGVWKEDVVQKASDPNELTQDELSISAYQNSLKPCERFDISEDAGYDGSQGAGKRYTMTCVE